MEASQGGCDQGPYAGCHLGIEQLEEMGAKFAESLIEMDFKPVPSGKSGHESSEKYVPILSERLAIEFADILATANESDSSGSSDEEHEEVNCDSPTPA